MPTHAQPPRSANFHPSDPVAVNDLHAPAKSKKAVPLDAIALIVLVGAANFFLAANDPGWLGLNPTPWLLIPIYLGARHGLPSAIYGSIAAIAAILTWRYLGLGELPEALLKMAPAYFGGILVSGIVTGIAYKIVVGRIRRLEDFSMKAGRENLRLEEDVAIYRENEAALQEALLLHGAEYTALTEELGQLFASEDCDLETGLLQLFHQHLGVTASAIFSRDESAEASESFDLIASRGADDLIPEEALDPASSRMISAAISSGKIVAASQMLDDGDSERSEPILAVIPWGADPGKADAICVIYRMAFDRVNWETLGRVEAIFDWSMARSVYQATTNKDGEKPKNGTGQQIFGPAPFRREIERARDAQKNLHIASRLIIFSPESEKLTADDQTHFVTELQQSIRLTDCLGAMVSLRGDYAIGLLSRFSTDKAAEIYASRLRELTEVKGIGFQVFDLLDSALEKSLQEAEMREAKAKEDSSASSSSEEPAPPEVVEAG